MYCSIGCWLRPCLARLTLRLVVGMAAVLAAAPVGNASPITYAYQGTIEAVGENQPVRAGDHFSGTISLDPDGPYEESFQGYSLDRYLVNQTSYKYGNTLDRPASSDVGMSLKVEGRPILDSVGVLNIRIDRTMSSSVTGDSRSTTRILFTQSFDGEGFDRFSYQILLQNSTFTAPNTSDPLPVALRLEDFPIATMTAIDITDDNILAGFDYPANRSYFGHIDSFSMIQTPEPTTLALLAAGALAWMARARKRRARIGRKV